jgi:hypothetical protein
VILRWQRLGLSNGFYGWSEHAAAQRRMAIAGEKIVLRWLQLADVDLNSTLAGEHFDAWAAFIEAKRKAEEAVETMGKQFSKIDKRMSETKVFKAWSQEVSTVKRHQHAARRIVCRWTRTSLAAPFHTWHVDAKELQRQRSLLDKTALRMKHAGMYKSLASWHDNAKEQQRQRAVLEKVALKMRSAGLYKGWARWEGQWRREKKMRRCAEKVVSRWRNMLLAPAFLALKESAQELKGMRKAGAKVILRWQRLGLSNGFYGWSEHAAAQRRMAIAGEKIVLRWRHLAISPALSRWTDYMSGHNRVARSAAKVVCRMQKMKLWSAFAKLEQVTISSRDSNARMGGCAALWEEVDKSIALATMRFVSDVFRFWRLRSLKNKQVYLIGARVSIRWRLKDAAFALKTWKNDTQIQRTVGNILRRLLLRMRKKISARAFSMWLDSAVLQSNSRSLCIRLLQQLRNLCLANAISLWAKQAAVLAKQRISCHSVLARLLTHTLSNAFCALEEEVGARKTALVIQAEADFRREAEFLTSFIVLDLSDISRNSRRPHLQVLLKSCCRTNIKLTLDKYFRRQAHQGHKVHAGSVRKLDGYEQETRARRIVCLISHREAQRISAGNSSSFQKMRGIRGRL